jgi:hypothetical protein
MFQNLYNKLQKSIHGRNIATETDKNNTVFEYLRNKHGQQLRWEQQAEEHAFPTARQTQSPRSYF